MKDQRIPLDTIEVAGITAGIDRTGLCYAPAISQNPVGGDFRLTLEGYTTRALPFDASKEDIEAALAEIRPPAGWSDSVPSHITGVKA